MLDDPAKFLLRSGKKAGNVFKGQQRNVERIAEAHEARAFHRSVDIENPGEVGGLIADDTDGAAVEPGKTNDKIFRIVFVDLEEIAFVHDGMNHFLDVVRFLWVRRNKPVEGLIAAHGRIRRGPARRILEIVRRQKTHQLADHRQAIGVIASDEVGHAAFFVMRHRTAQLLLGHFLVRNGLDDVRAGHEHVRSLARHENKISDRRRIHRASGAGSHDRADLRDDAARKRVAQKNVGVARERGYAFLDARAAGII